MSTVETQQNHPPRSRRDTFEKMLELEQRQKVNRMQASSYASHQMPHLYTNTGPGRDSSVDREQRPRGLQANGRAMTTSNLSLPGPLMEQANASTKYIISSNGDVIPQQEEEEQDSDASSICQSPGWDLIGDKKKKKEKKEREKKRKEKEKMERETAKLQKAPPRKRLSKLPSSADRSSSAPAVPLVPLVPVQVDPGEANKKPAPRTRRGSIELGFRNLLHAKKGIPTPWKSSHTSPVTPAEEIPSMPTSSSSGFIGGLKLRQSEEANTQDVMRRLKLAMDQEESEPLNAKAGVVPQLGGASPAASITGSTTPASVYAESVRTPSQWDSIYTQAALMVASTGDKILDEDVSMMERNIRKARRSHPPTSRYFDEGSRSRRDLSISSNRSSYPSDGQDSTVSSPTTNASSVPHDDSKHSRSSSYVQHSRQQSQEQLADSQASYAVGGSARPRKSESRGRSIFNRSRSRPRTAESDGVDGLVNPFHSKDDPSPQLHLGQTTESPTETTFTHTRKSSFSASSGVKGLRNAARAAFSKNGGSSHSSSEAHSSAEILTAKPYRPQTANRAATTDIASLKSTPPVNPERILGERNTPVAVPDITPRNPNRKHAPQVSRKDLDNTPTSSSSSSSAITQQDRAPSRSSSEEYSTPDEYSNVTTPTMSRPHSEAGYFPKVDDVPAKSKMNMSTSKIDQQREPYVMSGAIPCDDPTESGREDWSRTAVPIEITDDERGMSTPRGATIPQPSEGIIRKASLSRSASTPELQDLSFLPPLKHQPLIPRPKDKSKARKTKLKTDKSSKINAQPLVIPSPPPIPQSDELIPKSPLSSQYLKNARMALPRPANKSFGHSPVHQGAAGGPEPIAKMFVVCCSCKYFHDMPSKIYECMAKPDNVVRDTNLGVSGVVSTSVKCPWCAHGMSTKCCSGYAAVVYLKEKLH